MSGGGTHWAVSFSWVDYPWKNELATQAERIEKHFQEALDEDFNGEHSPLHMLERAVVLAAFSIRRLVEKRLLTDALAGSRHSVATFLATEDYRAPFQSQTGGRLLSNYDFAVPVATEMRLSDVANEIIHSSQLAILAGGDLALPDGLLVASDWNMKKRVLHIPMTILRSWIDAVLHDRVAVFTDEWDPETGKVRAVRDGRSALLSKRSG